jgi:intracellular septation protein
MTQLLDFVPIAVFVGVFFATDIYWATAALMVAVTAQVGAYLLAKKPISRELHMTFWASLVFGALTLLFRNETFIQWKPTIVNWLLAASLVGSFYVGKTNLLKQLLGHQLTLVDEVWTRLNFGWALGFFFAGALNLVVAYSFSMEFWVSYKLFGGFALTFLYIVITLVYLSRKGFLQVEEAESGQPDRHALGKPSGKPADRKGG